MAVVMQMTWAGVTPEQYDQVRKLVNWEGNVPGGAMFHVAAFNAEGARVTDIWESGEQFNEFVQNRLMPGVQQVGIAGQPEVEILPTHAIFTPAYTTK
jgi:hypothetical protein